MPRLTVWEREVTVRDLVQARSRTALACRLDARMLRAADSDDFAPPASPADDFFGQAELLEHALSFVTDPAQLARVGAVCSQWYIASRSGALWEGQLRIVHTMVARFVFGASFCISALVLNFYASVRSATCPRMYARMKSCAGHGSVRRMTVSR